MFGGSWIVKPCFGRSIISRLKQSDESQIKKYIHISNYFYQENQILLAEKILKLSGLIKIFFTNSERSGLRLQLKLSVSISKEQIKELVSF
jgi:acetylornithine/succinyldiaminopimelate/putrescine aminotransferase